MFKPSKHTFAKTEWSLLMANTYWFNNNKQRTTWSTTLFVQWNWWKKVARLASFDLLFFQTQQVSGFMFAISDFLFKTANRFPSCSLEFGHMDSTKLFPFPSLNFLQMCISVSNANWYFTNILKYWWQETLFCLKQLLR